MAQQPIPTHGGEEVVHIIMQTEFQRDQDPNSPGSVKFPLSFLIWKTVIIDKFSDKFRKKIFDLQLQLKNR